MQTAGPDRERSLSWPAYAANARRRHRCAALLMVFALTEDAARGCAKPIRMGHPGWELVPVVTGIGKTPQMPEPGGRFAAELVLLRLITRELTLDTHEARMFALAAIRSAPPKCVPRYTRYIKKLAPPEARPYLEILMKTMWKDAFVDGLLDQGRAENARENLLELLDARFSMSAGTRKRVDACKDIAQIKAWFSRAINAASIDEVFAELRALLGSTPTSQPGYPNVAAGLSRRR